MSCGQLDEAALWLTQNAAHISNEKEFASDSRSAVSFKTVEVKNLLLGKKKKKLQVKKFVFFFLGETFVFKYMRY